MNANPALRKPSTAMLEPHPARNVKDQLLPNLCQPPVSVLASTESTFQLKVLASVRLVTSQLMALVKTRMASLIASRKSTPNVPRSKLVMPMENAKTLMTAAKLATEAREKFLKTLESANAITSLRLTKSVTETAERSSLKLLSPQTVKSAFLTQSQIAL